MRGFCYSLVRLCCTKRPGSSTSNTNTPNILLSSPDAQIHVQLVGNIVEPNEVLTNNSTVSPSASNRRQSSAENNRSRSSSTISPPIALIQERGRVSSWKNRLQPLRVLIRTTLIDEVSVQGEYDIPAKQTLKEEYKFIEGTSKGIFQCLSYGDTTGRQRELSLVSGSCRIIFGEHDKVLLGKSEENYKLENLEDWSQATTVILNLVETVKIPNDLKIVITRELNYIKVPVTREDMPEPDKITRDWLYEQLHDHKKWTAGNDRSKYLSKENVEKHTSLEIIQNIINDAHDIDEEHRAEFAELVHHKAPRLFLVFIQREKPFKLLKTALDNGVTDENVPQSPYWLEGNRHKSAKIFWDHYMLTELWEFNAATFDTIGEHQDFKPEVIIPYIKRVDCGGGSFSKVYSVLLEPSHQNLYRCKDNKNPKLALKELYRHKNNDTLFEGEVVLLKGVRDLQHPHIIRLLATYKQNGFYNLLFPLAKCNLEQYMKKFEPLKSKRYLLWILNQIRGLASGLEQIHNQRGGETESPTAPSLLTPQPERTPKATGYHHDLKPSNILHFCELQEEITTPSPELGILQIADFGVGKMHPFHPQDKPSEFTKTSRGTPTYQAPESRVKRPDDESLRISRPYDVWALGCIMMEICTWIILGREGWMNFNESRSGPVDRTGVEENDGFFYIKDCDDRTQKAEVRKCVKEKMDELRNHECIKHGLESLGMTVDLVDTVLNVNPETRISASDLVIKLDKVLQRADEEENPYPDDNPGVPQVPSIHSETPMILVGLETEIGRTIHHAKHVRIAEPRPPLLPHAEEDISESSRTGVQYFSEAAEEITPSPSRQGTQSDMMSTEAQFDTNISESNESSSGSDYNISRIAFQD